ncbi:MAG TPA: hypothetical protein VJ785_11430 [Anaerolineales bacterium]|nr:hypothetical protein [Anaerolineales bacterium]
MSTLIDKSEEEIRVGDQILIIDLTLEEKGEILSEVIDIRFILGRPTYLVETESGDRKLVGDYQILRLGYSE